MLTRFAAGAALVLSAVSVQAAQSAQKVRIDFAFRTPAGEHAPGAYTVSLRDFASGAPFIHLMNDATRRSVMFYTQSPMMNPRSEDPSRLIFKCGSAGCDLAEVWNGINGHTIRRSKQAPADAEQSAVAVVVPAKTAAE
jgi:hypothetical protein